MIVLTRASYKYIPTHLHLVNVYLFRIDIHQLYRTVYILLYIHATMKLNFKDVNFTEALYLKYSSIYLHLYMRLLSVISLILYTNTHI